MRVVGDKPLPLEEGRPGSNLSTSRAIPSPTEGFITHHLHFELLTNTPDLQ